MTMYRRFHVRDNAINWQVRRYEGDRCVNGAGSDCSADCNDADLKLKLRSLSAQQ
jgi:hypothetical protein